MRLLLVGTPDRRARLREELDRASLTVVGEFDSLAAARASSVQADAILFPTSAGRASSARPSRLEESPVDSEYEEPLTARELEVLERLAEGLPNKSIAARLGISDQTVKFHVASICGKLGAANRTDAVRRALRRGLISF